MNIFKLTENSIDILGAKNAAKKIYHLYQDYIYEKDVIKNKKLKDSYKNQRCFILGTGVSINEVNLSLLASEYTFGCNYLYAHKSFKDLNIDFYTSIGPVRNFNYGNHYDTPLIYYKTINNNCRNKDTTFFFTCTNKNYYKKNALFQNRKVHYVNLKTPDKYRELLVNDLSKRTTVYCGVLGFMISAAIYMGFKELYLCGTGYTYQPILEYFFYDEYVDFLAHSYYQKPIFHINISGTEREKKIKKIEDQNGIRLYNIKRRNSYYIATFVSDHVVHPNHRVIRDSADLNNVKIYNIVPDGFSSPVYHGVSWQHVVEKVLNV